MEILTLSRADMGKLQDAWHYATLITNRTCSTFDGDREFPEGVRGQMVAYERLIQKLNEMTADHETWELVAHKLFLPISWADLEANARWALNVINNVAAVRFGRDARTCELL